jgi:ubiquinone/menaquinone biosynthesis C-methylase UbiE/uncharacterized protein YbaR (Trm112 family)
MSMPIADFFDRLCCPLCKQALILRGERCTCSRCEREYPVVLGIPDLRVYSDPYVTIEEDHRKGKQVQAQAEKMSFAELLRFYWENVSLPPTPVDLREGFIRHVLSDVKRVESFQDRLGSGKACLDVGCGAGSLVGVAQRKFEVVIGCDIAFRWLILARKRLEEMGVAVNLICCCADYLPFRSESFDLVTGISMLEHVQNAQAVVNELSRVQSKNGRLFLWTANRFSIAPEPHVHLWGVGFLPRRWMPIYVKWRRGLSYDKQHLLSCFDIRRMLTVARYDSLRFSLPQVIEEDHRGRSGIEKLGAKLFSLLRSFPLVRRLLIPVSPALLVLAKKLQGNSVQHSKHETIAPVRQKGWVSAVASNGFADRR